MRSAVAQWLRCYATNRKVAGSIPAGIKQCGQNVQLLNVKLLVHHVTGRL